jgi:hypothetical protein
MASPNLAITHINASQNTKEVTANTAFDELDKALTDKISIAMSDADYVLSTAEGGEALGHLAYVFTGVLTANRNIVAPNNKKLYVVSNQTTGGHDITVKTAAGTGIAIHSATFTILYCDGTNVVTFSTGGSGATAFTGLTDAPASYSGDGGYAVQVNAGATALEFKPKIYRLYVFMPGVGSNAQVLFRNILVDAVTFPAGAAGSKSGPASAAATGSTTFTFKKNGTSFATLVVAASGTSGAWTQASDAVFNGTSDILEIDGPATADATLADFGISFAGIRS